jgi:hypothetical protein
MRTVSASSGIFKKIEAVNGENQGQYGADLSALSVTVSHTQKMSFAVLSKKERCMLNKPMQAFFAEK